MTVLTVDTLPLDPVPVVRLHVETTGAWSLHGRGDGLEWKVGAGDGDAWVGDPWAPLNQVVTYELRRGSQVSTSEPVIRIYDGWDALTDMQGRGGVDFMWMKDGGAPVEQDVRHEFFDVPGSAWSPYLSAPVAGAGGGSLVARTSGTSTRALRALLARNVPVVLHHNENRCRRGDCDIPPARTVVLTAAPEDLTSRMDVAERSWSLTYRLVPPPWGYLPPVATLADMYARFPTVGDLADSGLTVGELAAGGWMVGW